MILGAGLAPYRRALRARPGAAFAIGAATVAALVVVALVGPAVSPADPFATSTARLRPPGPGHPFGTDDLGRDVLAGVLHGTRISLLVGLIAAVTAGAIGTLVGLVSGYAGGAVDDVLMRATEFVQVLPRFFLAVLVAAVLGPSIWVLAALIGVTFWTGTARIVRSQVLSLREREFVLAARAIGLGAPRIAFRHVLPNVLAIVIVTAALQVGAAILIEASLSFLGLGDRSVVSWGRMLNDAQPFLRLAPWMSLFPGLALVLTVLGANLLADGIYDAWDPRTRRR